MSVYINPYTDFGFKKLFGEEGNKDLLIDFLNPFLPSHHQIADLTFHNVESLADTLLERKAFFDIHCQSASGERFIVEMQKAKVRHFKDRSLYYITYPIREQAHRGGAWDFKLGSIYFIAVLDFLYDTDLSSAKFLRTVKFTDQDGDIFYDKLQLTYLQMPAFNKSASELETRMDKWAYFLKNLEFFEEIPQILNEPLFSRAFHTAKLSNLDAQQWEQYDKDRLQYIGIREVANTAHEEGREEGREEGIAQGRAQERAKAEAEKAQLKAQLILDMLAEGFSIAQVAKIAKVAAAEIEQIISKYQK